jgi:molecular chaperone GrpE
MNEEKKHTESIEQDIHDIKENIIEEKNTNNEIKDSNTPNSSETETAEKQAEQDEIAKLKAELEEQKDKYLRLYSEFDNYRKRTNKEKVELIQTAGKEVIISLLPVLDDLERAKKSIETSNDIKAITEGIELVFNKLIKTLEGMGLKAIDAMGQPFDADVHEAISQVPAPSEDLKGKVVDVLEKGYQINDKIIRYSKVVIGI